MGRKRSGVASSVAVLTETGERYELRPVPMAKMPSTSPSLWLRFQGLHIPGSTLSEADQLRVQAFMRDHKTEALTDGHLTLTLAGGRLAQCFPDRLGDSSPENAR